MSKLIQFPNGQCTEVSDKVADILLQRKGHSLAVKGEPEPKPEPKKKNREQA